MAFYYHKNLNLYAVILILLSYKLYLKIMKTNLFYLLLILLLASCDKDDSSKERYNLSINYLTELGNIVVDPLLENYPQGTLIKVKAIPNEGIAFQNWEMNSTLFVQKELAFVIENDTELFANFIDKEQESFTLLTSCDINQGKITVDPVMDLYPMGTEVKISVTANKDFEFSHWDGISSKDAVINIDMTQDFDIRAVFMNNDGTPAYASDVFFELDIIWNDDNTWTANAEISNKKTYKGINGAIIKVNNKVLIEHDFFEEKYSGAIAALTPDQEVTVSVQYNQEASKTFKLKVPPVFTNNPALTGYIKNGVATINWEKVNCSEYVLYKLLENTTGSNISGTESDGVPLVSTTYSSPVSDILNSVVQLSPTAEYFTFWVSPANTLSNLQGFYAKSYIKIIGEKSNSISNKPKS